MYDSPRENDRLTTGCDSSNVVDSTLVTRGDRSSALVVVIAIMVHCETTFLTLQASKLEQEGNNEEASSCQGPRAHRTTLVVWKSSLWVRQNEQQMAGGVWGRVSGVGWQRGRCGQLVRIPRFSIVTPNSILGTPPPSLRSSTVWTWDAVILFG
jgi:hypothetical protein